MQQNLHSACGTHSAPTPEQPFRALCKRLPTALLHAQGSFKMSTVCTVSKPTGETGHMILGGGWSCWTAKVEEHGSAGTEFNSGIGRKDLPGNLTEQNSMGTDYTKLCNCSAAFSFKDCTLSAVTMPCRDWAVNQNKRGHVGSQ